MKITGSSNVGTVNHATENLQHRFLQIFLIDCENEKRGKTQASEGKAFCTCTLHIFAFQLLHM